MYKPKLILLLFAFVATSLGFSQLEAQTKLKLSARYQIEKGTRRGWLVVTAKIPGGNHIYSLTQKGTPPPSKIVVANSDEFEMTKNFKPSKKPKVVEKDPIFGTRVEKHDGTIAFLAPIQISPDAPLEDLFIDVKFSTQVCSSESCIPVFDQPIEVEFGGYFVKQSGEKGR